MADPHQETAGTRRLDPSLLLVFAGIVLVFLAFLSASIWDPSYALYFLVGGVLVLAAGFVLASRAG